MLVFLVETQTNKFIEIWLRCTAFKVEIHRNDGLQATSSISFFGI